MPKKRHPTRFTKPQSTPPPSLASSRARSADKDNHHVRSVNELLADLRRVGMSSSGSPSGPGGSPHTSADRPSIAATVHPTPSVPPALRQILQLPETPAPILPRSRRPAFDAQGRRLPPGPPAPRSWLSQSRHAPQIRRIHGELAGAVPGVDFTLHELPGLSTPDRGSLLDLAMAAMAADWEFQRRYNKYWLYMLPDHLRQPFIRYLGAYSRAGASVADLRLLLLPLPDLQDDEEPERGGTDRIPNENIRCLDVTGSLGESLELKELTGLLFPRPAVESDPSTGIQESWEAAPDMMPAPRPPLLPNLTRISLAANPRQAHRMSWRQLLSFSRHAGGAITHLSLAHWPEPTLTPNAIGATVDSPAGAVQYGGTGFYSHSLDDDWSEAVSVLKRLSKNMYGLEYLDLTGCGAWTEALARASSGGDASGSDGGSTRVGVDWVGAWGKVTTLLLYWGYHPPGPDRVAETSGFLENIARANRIERHIVSMRKGRGRFIEVAKDRELES